MVTPSDVLSGGTVPMPESVSVRFQSECRACGGRLADVGSLGNQYVVGFPEQTVDRSTLLQAPLDVTLCEDCGLVQLRHTVNADRLFRKFWYRSGINPQMRAALQDVVNSAVSRIGGLTAGDAVADIGSNDGTLTSMYPKSIHTVGFEPCAGLALEAQEKGTAEVVFSTYFGRSPKVDAVLRQWHQTGFRIITALAMFYDVEHPRAFLRDVVDLLHEDGIFVLQMNSLRGMLASSAFDNISHEHLCYYSLSSLQNVFQESGLRIVDVEENQVNGGSLRVYATHADTPLFARVDPRIREDGLRRVEAMVVDERDAGICRIDTLRAFFRNQRAISARISEHIRSLAAAHKQTYVYGASTRGTALVQTLPEDVRGLLCGAAERDSNKYGKMMVGSWTPIVSEEDARKVADCFLLLPWHFLWGTLDREQEWLHEAGHAFLVPLPVPRLVFSDRVVEL